QFFSKDKISNEFGLENIQESVNDLYENTNSISIRQLNLQVSIKIQI
ncbi:19534_t:CDS:1, partial [Gigaspora margarita]